MKLRHFSVSLPIVSPGPAEDDFLPDGLDVAVLGEATVCLAFVAEEFDVHHFQLAFPAELAHSIVFYLEVLFAYLAADHHFPLSHSHH